MTKYHENHPIPLTEATYFILLSLSREPKHGYAITKDVEALSGGRVRFSTGTLYGAIKRLLADEWIRRIEGDGQPHPNRARKVYELTDKGRTVLEAEYTRLSELVRVTAARAIESNV